MRKLPCDNLQAFKEGINHFYTVYEGKYAEGQHVILYNGDDQAKFRIEHIIHFADSDVLGLRRAEE